jgi:hypothetical protein
MSISAQDLTNALEFDVRRPDFGFCAPNRAKAMITAMVELLKHSKLPKDHPAVVAAVQSINAVERDLDEVPPRHIVQAIAAFDLDDEIEFDQGFGITDAGDNGVYVQIWKWVEFADTPLDRENSESALTPEQIIMAERFFTFVLAREMKTHKDAPSIAARDANLGTARDLLSAIDNTDDHPDFDLIVAIASENVESLYETITSYMAYFGKTQKLMDLLPAAVQEQVLSQTTPQFDYRMA